MKKTQFTKEKANKILDIISIMMISVMVLLSGIYIGSPLKDPIYILFIISNLYTAFYILIKKILLKKNIIIQNKIDLVILIFVLANFIPAIFQNMTTLEGTIYNIHLYITLYGIYIIVKNSIRTKKSIYMLAISFIVASLFPIILGIDMMTTNYFSPFLKFIHAVTIEQNRMGSTFGYPNSLAVYMVIGIFFALFGFFNTKNKYLKPIWTIYTFLAIFTILQSFSRATILLFGILLILYFVLIRNKEKNSQLLLLLATASTFALLYYLFFNYLVDLKKYHVMWSFLPIFCIVTYIVHLYINELTPWLVKIPNKIILMIILVATLMLSSYIIIGFQIPDKLELFKNITTEEVQNKDIYGLQPNTHYKFTLNLSTQTISSSDHVYQIQIVERNQYYVETILAEETFGNFEGMKKLEITTTPEMSKVFIRFSKKISNVQAILTIHEMKIDEKPYYLSYKLLPEKVVYIFQNLNFHNKSMEERVTFAKDAIKIIKNNWLLGIGGDGWYYQHQDVQEYVYSAREPHCYPLQIWLENGIVGVITYLLAIFLVLIQWIKQNRQERHLGQITILMIFLLLILHSIMDFDLSFLCIMMQLFICFGVLNQKEKYQKKNHLEIMIFILIIVNLVSNTSAFVAQKKQEVIQQNCSTLLDYEKAIANYETVIQLDPFKKEYKIHYINLMSNALKIDKQNENIRKKLIQNLEKLMQTEPYYSRITVTTFLISNYIEDINIDNKEEYMKKLKELYDQLVYHTESVEFNIQNIAKRIQSVNFLAQKAKEKYEETKFEELKQFSKKLYQLLFSEKEELMQNANNKKNKQEGLSMQFYLLELEKIYEKAQKQSNQI